MIYKGICLSLGIALAAYSPLSSAIDATDLLANSPFVHAKIVPGQGGAGTAQQYVFRGICKLGDEVLVNISDTVKKKTYWIKIGETAEDIKVISYDEETKKVSIIVGARDYVLELSKPKVATPQVVAAKPDNAKKEQSKLPRRVKRTRRTGSIPSSPPNIDFSNPNFPKNINPNALGSSGGSTTVIKSDSSDSDSSTESDDSDSSSSTPPTTIPGDPPSYVPEIPSGVKEMMNSGNIPNVSQ